MLKKIIMYSTDHCPYCRAAKALLQAKGVTFDEINVEGDTAKRAWLAEVTGMKTVPQIFIDDKPYGGFDDISALDRQGKLNGLLGL